MSNDNEVKFKRKPKRKKSLGYFYLFAFVFLAALAFMSYLVKSYSPDVDVEIGNKENLTLSEEDMDVEIKNIDERLKWIQEEDEMPSVALREGERKNTAENNKDKIVDYINEEPARKEPIIPLPSKPVDDTKNQNIQPENKHQNTQIAQNAIPPKIPAPIPKLTKVYLGSFESIEEAMSIQEKVNSDMPESMPFVKAIDNKYIVQLGSFSKKETADIFVSKLRENGYNPKVSEQ